MGTADFVRFTLRTLLAHRLRTALTAFGVSWGIFMLVLMLAGGSGLENGARRDFQGTATNSFFVWGQRTSKPYNGLPVGRQIIFANEDIGAIRAQYLGSLAGKILRINPATVVQAYRDLELEGLVIGVTAKRALWESLRGAVGETIDGISLGELSARADEQRTRLEELRGRAAAEAFTGRS